MRSSILDPIFITISKSGNVMIIWIILALILIYKKYKFDLNQVTKIVVVPGIIVVINEFIIKGIIKRPRPFLNIHDYNLLVNIPHGYSMPSGHSLASFMMATILAAYFPKYKIFYYLYAGLIAFSRVYVGVHYPSDVLVGAILGLVLAKVYLVIIKKYFHDKKVDK